MKRPEEVYEWLKDLENLFGDNEYITSAKMFIGSFEQIMWERDIAIEQLHELGYNLGEKISRKD